MTRHRDRDPSTIQCACGCDARRARSARACGGGLPPCGGAGLRVAWCPPHPAPSQPIFPRL
jgi:hypothetical protein